MATPVRSTLQVRKHRIVEGAHVFEIWYGGVLVGEVTGAEGPGVRILCNRRMQVSVEDGNGILPNVVTVITPSSKLV